jgi:hypothetical protein
MLACVDGSSLLVCLRESLLRRLLSLQFVFNVLLLNVLIASMSNSFSKISQVGMQYAT